MASVLSPDQVARFHADGYLVVPDLLTAAEVSGFLEHVAQANVGRFGLMGHRVDPQYRALATHPRIAGAASEIVGGRVRVVQTMYLDKRPAGGRGIALHQDTHYLPNEPNTLMACWIAFTDTDPANGGLCVVPGSHREGLRSVHRTEDTRHHDSWEHVYAVRDRDGREWEQRMFSFEIAGLDPARLRRLTVPAGGGVFFSGMTIHGSFANESSDRPRKAWAVHYVREDTWLYRQDVQEAMLVETAA
jgi:phytanoyl-CoA hydroxylase